MKHHHIANNLRVLRNKLGLSQSEIANALSEFIDMNQKKYASYEQDRTEPNIDTIKTLADFFGVTMEELCYTEQTL